MKIQFLKTQETLALVRNNDLDNFPLDECEI